jgi:hypothetical protein
MTLDPPAATETHLRPTKTALDALVTILRGLEWEPSPDRPAQPAFKRVELFDDLDLPEAFKRLLISESRIALVIYSSDTFENQRSDRQMIIRRKQELYVVFTDRVMGKRIDALLGADNNPGLLVLRDLVLPAITGLLVPQPAGIICAPTRGSLLQVEDTDRKLPGRLAYLLEIELQGGWLKADVGKSPVW